MTNFANNFENFTARPGLYRVWVPLRDDGRVPLVSIWIDSTMTAFEPHRQKAGIALLDTNEGEMGKENYIARADK